MFAALASLAAPVLKAVAPSLIGGLFGGGKKQGAAPVQGPPQAGAEGPALSPIEAWMKKMKLGGGVGGLGGVMNAGMSQPEGPIGGPNSGNMAGGYYQGPKKANQWGDMLGGVLGGMGGGGGDGGSGLFGAGGGAGGSGGLLDMLNFH